MQFEFCDDGNNNIYVSLKNKDELNNVTILFYNLESGEIVLNDDSINIVGIDNIEKLIHDACFHLSSRLGVTPIIKSKVLNKELKIDEQDKKIIDIKPIIFDGDINLDDVSTINECIELPLRKACSILHEKGIQTIMSSCNSNDVKYRNSKIKGYDLGHVGINESPFFIGNGYAWIMIDWISLSEENKKIFVDYNLGILPIDFEERELKIIDSNMKNDMKDLPVCKQITRFFEIINQHEFIFNRELFGKLPQESINDEIYDKNRSGVLSTCSLNNHGDDFRTVVIRYPIDEETTVREVESFFINYISVLKQQEKLDKKSLKI